jgi:RNA polymerase sigma-70 factor (ECF subfamily)
MDPLIASSLYASPGSAPRVDEAGMTADPWTDLVGRVQLSDASGMTDLYDVIRRGLRPFLARQLKPQDFEDKVHEIFVDVVLAIRQGQLREPERLMGFVRTVARRKVAVYIDAAARNRRNQVECRSAFLPASPHLNPEVDLIWREQRAWVQWTLGHLTKREADILRRFYLQEESQSQICLEMHLTGTQFRLLKWRSKAHFEQLSRKKLVTGQPRAHGANRTNQPALTP